MIWVRHCNRLQDFTRVQQSIVKFVSLAPTQWTITYSSTVSAAKQCCRRAYPDVIQHTVFIDICMLSSSKSESYMYKCQTIFQSHAQRKCLLHKGKCKDSHYPLKCSTKNWTTQSCRENIGVPIVATRPETKCAFRLIDWQWWQQGWATWSTCRLCGHFRNEQALYLPSHAHQQHWAPTNGNCAYRS